MLREEFVPQTSFEKLEIPHTSNLTANLTAIEQKEERITKRSRQQEIFKLRAETNKVEKRRKILRIKKTKNWLFE